MIIYKQSYLPFSASSKASESRLFSWMVPSRDEMVTESEADSDASISSLISWIPSFPSREYFVSGLNWQNSFVWLGTSRTTWLFCSKDWSYIISKNTVWVVLLEQVLPKVYGYNSQRAS